MLAVFLAVRVSFEYAVWVRVYPFQLVLLLCGFISGIIKTNVITYADGFDKICLIVDRDKESFLEEQGNNRNMLLENPKVSSKRGYTEHELRKLLKGYSKNNYNAELLIGKIDTAMKNVKEFCNNIQQLQSEVGSNLGNLITDLKVQL